MNEDEEIELVVRPNKSQLKRDVKKKTDTVTQLIELSMNDIVKLVTDDFIMGKINEVRPLKPSSAKNRLLKYITKNIDSETLARADKFISDRHGYERISNAFFHGLEKKRDLLLDKGDAAIQMLMNDYPELDRQQLRQLVRQGVKERDNGKPVGAAKKIYKYLRENVEAPEK